MDAANPPKNKTTVEMYRDLLQVEVKSLMARVTELTTAVGAMFGEVNGIALQMENTVNKMGSMATGLDYCREEIKTIKNSISGYEKQLVDIQEKVKSAETKLHAINVKVWLS